MNHGERMATIGKICEECGRRIFWGRGYRMHCCGCGAGITYEEAREKYPRSRNTRDGMVGIFYHDGRCWDERPSYPRKRCCVCGEMMEHDHPDTTRVRDCKTGKPVPRKWGHQDCLEPCEV